MAKVVVLGAGIAGHTAALFLRRGLNRKHSVTVVSPAKSWNWVPSNIWVGVGRMSAKEVLIPLKPVYDRLGIEFVHAKATLIRPERNGNGSKPSVVAKRTDNGSGEEVSVDYDFLVNATGPWLDFDATAGLGPEGHTFSVCTAEHAADTAEAFGERLTRLRRGEKQTFVIGTGHGTCTCEGAAFEYAFNLEAELRRAKLRQNARVVFLTNEPALGDFGVGGLYLKRAGYVVHSRTFAESLYAERGIEWVTGTHVSQVEANKINFETLEGEERSIDFDFSMLIPPFRGVDIKAEDGAGNDITDKLFASNRFMKVDADYTPKPFEEWRAADWPVTYQSPAYGNIFAIGIAFAPPHAISRPHETKRGTKIAPAAPRTGMPSAIMGRTVARNITDMINKGLEQPRWGASLANLGAACVASAGTGFLGGTAAAMTIYPIVPDFEKYPVHGRDLSYTFGEIGSAGHWIKRILHHMFIYKAKARPFWWMIPE